MIPGIAADPFGMSTCAVGLSPVPSNFAIIRPVLSVRVRPRFAGAPSSPRQSRCGLAGLQRVNRPEADRNTVPGIDGPDQPRQIDELILGALLPDGLLEDRQSVG